MTTPIDNLSLILDQQIEQLQLFSGLLEQEFSALKQRDREEILAIADRKTQQAVKIESLSQKMQGILGTFKTTSTGEKLDDHILATGDQGLIERWQAFITLTRECQQRNGINGGMIETGRRFSQQLLDIIKGDYSDNGLYGRNGQRSGPGSGQTLAQA